MTNRSTLFFYFTISALASLGACESWYRDCQIYKNFDSDFKRIPSSSMHMHNLGKDVKNLDNSLYHNYADTSDQNIYYLFSKAIQKRNIAGIGEYFEHRIRPKARTILPFYVDCVVRSFGIVEEAGILQEYVKPFSIAVRDRKLTLEFTLLKMKEVLQSLEVLFRNGFYYVGLSSGQMGISSFEIREEFANYVNQSKATTDSQALEGQILNNLQMAIKRKMRGENQKNNMDSGKKVFVSRGKVRFIHRIGSKCRPESFKNLNVYLDRYTEVKEHLGSNTQKIKTDYDFCVKMDLFEYILALEKFFILQGNAGFSFKKLLVVIEATILEENIGDISTATYVKELYNEVQEDLGTGSAMVMQSSQDSDLHEVVNPQVKVNLVNRLLVTINDKLKQEEMKIDERIVKFFIEYRYYRRELLEFLFIMHHIKQKYARRLIILLIEDLLRYIKGESLIYDENQAKFKGVMNEFIFLRFLKFSSTEHSLDQSEQNFDISDLMRNSVKKSVDDDSELNISEHNYNQDMMNNKLFEKENSIGGGVSMPQTKYSSSSVIVKANAFNKNQNIHKSLDLGHSSQIPNIFDVQNTGSKSQKVNYDDDSSNQSSQKSEALSSQSQKNKIILNASNVSSEKELQSLNSEMRSKETDKSHLQTPHSKSNHTSVKSISYVKDLQSKSNKSTVELDNTINQVVNKKSELTQSQPSLEKSIEQKSRVSKSKVYPSQINKSQESVIDDHNPSRKTSQQVKSNLTRDDQSNSLKSQIRDNESRNASEKSKDSKKYKKQTKNSMNSEEDYQNSFKRNGIRKTSNIKGNLEIKQNKALAATLKTNRESYEQFERNAKAKELNNSSAPNQITAKIETRSKSELLKDLKQKMEKKFYHSRQGSQKLKNSNISQDIDEDIRSNHQLDSQNKSNRSPLDTKSLNKSELSKQTSPINQSETSSQKNKKFKNESPAKIQTKSAQIINTKNESQSNISRDNKSGKSLDSQHYIDQLTKNRTNSFKHTSISPISNPASKSQKKDDFSHSSENKVDLSKKIQISQNSDSKLNKSKQSITNLMSTHTLRKDNTFMQKRKEKASKKIYIKRKKKNHVLYKKIITNFDPKEARDEQNFDYITETSTEFDQDANKEIEIEKITAIPKNIR